jgi:hypothetical protein
MLINLPCYQYFLPTIKIIVVGKQSSEFYQYNLIMSQNLDAELRHKVDLRGTCEMKINDLICFTNFFRSKILPMVSSERKLSDLN